MSRLAATATCVALCVLPSVAAAQPGPRLEITVSPTSVSFPSANPDVSPVVAAAPVVVTIRIRQSSGPWSLTVLANGDLLAGASTVDITNVSWTATPAPPFQNGVLSKTVAQSMTRLENRDSKANGFQLRSATSGNELQLVGVTFGGSDKDVIVGSNGGANTGNN